MSFILFVLDQVVDNGYNIAGRSCSAFTSLYFYCDSLPVFLRLGLHLNFANDMCTYEFLMF